MPKVDVIDMRLEFVETRRQDLFSRALEEAIRNRLEQGEQVMMLLNRRGFSSYVACRSCGERIECQNCSVTLTFHRQARKLECHYCDYAEPVPSLCPKCESEHIYFIGSGSEKVEDYLRRTLPEARIARFRLEHPDADPARDLAAWAAFEAEHPRTFAAMYQFWCVRTEGRPPRAA